MEISCFGMTDPGSTRAINEDFFLFNPDLGLCLVCDGFGSNGNGSIASHKCAEVIQSVLLQNRSTLQESMSAAAALLEKAIQEANVSIQNGMGTSLEALLISKSKDRAIHAHVGGTRSYLLNKTGVHLLTEDHLVGTEMLKQGTWTAEQAHKSPYARVLTRAVGSQAFVHPDILFIDLAPGDTILMCSDGLSDILAPTEFSDAIRRGPMTRVPGELVKAAKTKGSKDNITAAVVHAGAPQAAAQDSTRLNKNEALMRIPLFRYLTYAEVMKLVAVSTVRTYPEGTTVFEEGAPGTTMLILLSGKVNVRKNGQIIASRSKGEFIGELALFNQVPRSASVIAAESTQAMTLHRPDFLALLRKEPSIAVKLLWAMNQELNRRLAEVSSDLAEAKAGAEALHTHGGLPFFLEQD